MTGYVEYRDTADRSEWGKGEWDGEADKAQWIDDDTGFDCLIVRNRSGALCGYVGVPPTHPWFEKPYDAVDVRVHGGLTFADRCHEPTRKEWEQLPREIELARAEAARYPTGYSARYIKRNAPLVDSFEKWAAHAQATRICHVPQPGRPEVWWFGFDTAHSGDIVPSMNRRDFNFYDDTYKDWRYVTRQVERLARQLKAMCEDDYDDGF